MKRIMVVFCVIGLLSAAPAFSQETGPAMPVFPSRTGEAVLFRYKHVPGQRVDMEVVMAITMTMFVMENDIDIDMEMWMTGSYTVLEVMPDGSADVEFVFSRIIMDVSSIMDMHYDSANPDSSSPELANFDFFIDTPVLYRIDPRGEILSSDIGPIMEAFSEAGEAFAKADIDRQFSEYTKSSFIQLAAESLREGDVYEAGVLSNSMSGIEMNVATRYRVEAVSGDKRYAILVPMIDVTLSENDMSGCWMDGWILFDLERGNIAESYAVMHMAFDYKEYGQVIPVVADTTIRYMVDLEK